MKRVFSILYIICCCTLESADAQSAGISEVLKELQMENISVVQKSYKKLKAVSRQPLTNFVNLKSNTIMKKPRCKDTGFS